MQGHEGITQSLEADAGVSWGRLELWICWSVYPGFEPKYLLLSKEVILPIFFFVG